MPSIQRQIVLTLALLGLAPIGAGASVIYTYHGSAFATTTGDFTRGDRLDGWMVFAEPLPNNADRGIPGLALSAYTPEAFGFTVGGFTLDDQSAVTHRFRLAAVSGFIVPFAISLGSDAGWIALEDFSIRIQLANGSTAGDPMGYGDWWGPPQPFEMTSQRRAISTISMISTISQVPEPGLFGLLALGGIVWQRRRWRQWVCRHRAT
jgi:hypothetical protein